MEYVGFEVGAPGNIRDKDAMAEFGQHITDVLAPQIQSLGISPVWIIPAVGHVRVVVGGNTRKIVRMAGNQLVALLRRKGYTIGRSPQKTFDVPPPSPRTKPPLRAQPPAQPIRTLAVSNRPTKEHCKAIFDTLLAAGRPLGAKDLMTRTGLSRYKVRAALLLLIDSKHAFVVLNDGVHHHYTLSAESKKSGVLQIDPSADPGEEWGRRAAPSQLAILRALEMSVRENPDEYLTLDQLAERIPSVKYHAIWSLVTKGVKRGLVAAHTAIGKPTRKAYRLTDTGLTAARAYLRTHAESAITEDE